MFGATKLTTLVAITALPAVFASSLRSLKSELIMASVCVLENNVDYAGNDIGNKLSANAEGCCSLCQLTTNCHAFSWNGDNGGTCYLKSMAGQKIYKAGVRSAMVTSTNDCPAQEYGVDYLGNDLTNKPSSTPEGCCQLCKDVANCRAYSWTNQSGGTCYLKYAKTGIASNPGVTSAQLYGNQDPKCDWEYGVDYLGNDIGKALGPVESCCGKCAQFPGCRAYSWKSDAGGTCYFKSAKAQTLTNSNVISSVVYF